MAIEISDTDVADAQTFIQTLLEQSVPEGRFTPGSALNDLTVKALAFVFAELRKENNQVQAMQSLLNVQTIATNGDPDTDKAVSDAVDAILSNWFITRKSGSFTRGVVNIQVSVKQDYLLPGNNRFLFSRNLAFFPDVTDPSQTIVIPANTLFPVLSTTGAIQGYAFRQRVVAARTGTAYNVDAGTWIAGRQFSPFATQISNEVKFEGGRDREDTSTLISRSNNAVAVRNLINERSIDATLRDLFSDIQALITIGMGDPEMQRDKKIDTAAGLKLHVGGCFDIYTQLPRVQATFQGQLGGKFVRPDNIANVFRDTTSISDWTVTGIQVGDIVRIATGLADAPIDYTIKQIFPTELRVSESFAFSAPTDEAGTFVDYFIYRPLFGPDIQLVPVVGVNTTGQTSRTIQTANHLVLPGGAHYAISDVAVLNPDAGDANINPIDGYVHFPVRSNDLPNPVVSAEFLEFQVVNNNPSNAQSESQLEELILEPTYNNKTVRVIYETLAGLDAVDSFVTDRFQRVLCANVLARGFNPVYLSMVIPYKIKPTATTVPNLTNVNQVLVDLINNFDVNDIIDVSDIITAVRDADANIGTVLMFNIEYALVVPDGRLLNYLTADLVSLDSSKLVVDTSSINNLLNDPLSLGVSNRTIRYMTTSDRITFNLVA